MKNILNNLSGGFFRTLGRVLLYLLIGFIGSYILRENGIKLTHLFGILQVNAAELTAWSRQQTRLTYDNAGSSSFSDWETAPYTFSNMSLPVKRVQFRVRSSNGLSVDNTYNFTFGYLPNPDAVGWGHVAMLKNGESNYSESNFTCGQPYVNNNGYYLIDCSINPQYSYTSTDDLWITIYLSGNGGYLTTIRPYMFGYDERLGTNAVITEQTNMINNSINNLANDINNSATNIINGINESNQVCTIYDKNDIELKNKVLYSSGNIGDLTGYGISNYINISNAISLKFTYNFGNGGAYCFYNINKTLISCAIVNALSANTLLTIPNNSYYLRSTIREEYNSPQIEVCKNGNNAITDALTDDSSPDVSSLNDMAGWLPAGPLDSILILPLTLLNSLNTALSGTCSPISLTLPYINENLTLPCITSIYQEIGAITFVNWVGTIASAFILFKYLMKLYKWVDDTLTFRENNWLDNWGGVD